MEIALAKVVTIIILLMMIVSSVTPSVASVLDPQIPNVLLVLQVKFSIHQLIALLLAVIL
jgi:hypothetical protein